MRWDPDVVLIGSAAAWVSFWPEIRVSRIVCGLKHHRRPQAGYEFTRQQVPAELVVNRSGIRYTSPALTALDLCGAMGGDPIDQALMTRATTLAQLHRAMELTAARVGNRTRRQLLLDFRAEPWSKAERLFHRHLRDAGITGWQANRPVVLDDSTFYVDILFRKLKLVIEIDGRLALFCSRGAHASWCRRHSSRNDGIRFARSARGRVPLIVPPITSGRLPTLAEPHRRRGLRERPGGGSTCLS